MRDVYQVIRKPLLTEKTNFQNEMMNKVVFEVDRRASKPEIRVAVEKNLRGEGEGCAHREHAGQGEILQGQGQGEDAVGVEASRGNTGRGIEDRLLRGKVTDTYGCEEI